LTGEPKPAGNAVYYGDNLDVLRDHIRDESVDLVYLDPPFNSNATYNVLFKPQVAIGRGDDDDPGQDAGPRPWRPDVSGPARPATLLSLSRLAETGGRADPGSAVIGLSRLFARERDRGAVRKTQKGRLCAGLPQL
jgi:hypothetical protein